MNLATLRSSVRKATGIPAGDPDLTDIEIDLYLNRSFWEVMDKFPFREKERTGAFETEAGIRNYEIPQPVEAVRNFAIVDPLSLQHVPLDLMDARETERLYDESEDQWAIPQKYILENCYVRFWPTPDQVYTIEMRKWTILDDIGASGIPIPQVWNDIILYGANQRAFIDLGDYGRATFFKTERSELINSLVPRPQKEINDVQHAGLYVLGREY